MDLIVLQGNPNVGKTGTLNTAYQFLLKKGYTQVPGCFIDLFNNDFLDILEFQGKRVGIVTQGDYAKGICFVGNHLAHLDSLGCHKAICAQTLGPSKSRIARAIATYPNTIVTKTANPIVALQRIDDHTYANRIVAFV